MRSPKTLAKKLDRIADEIGRGKGELSVFALVVPEGRSGSFDLVVAAPWIGNERLAAIGYIGRKLQKHLSKSDFKLIWRIVPVEEDHPIREALERIETRGLGAWFTSFHAGEMEVHQAHVIRPKMAA